MIDLKIWTDGSCLGNPGPGGWASITEGLDRKLVKRNGGHPNTTNNQMELLAVVDTLRALGGQHHIAVFSDSTYVVNGVTAWMKKWKENGWTTSNGKPVKNRELWEELWHLTQQHNISFHHVHRNSTIEMIAVDALARGTAEQWRQSHD